jgi:hypothetical protein
MKQTRLQYYLSTYSVTGWPFFGMNIVRIKFGHNTRDALNQLFKDGYIRKRPGANVDIIEIKKFE